MVMAAVLAPNWFPLQRIAPLSSVAEQRRIVERVNVSVAWSTAMPPPCVVNPSQTTTTTVDMLERLLDSLEEGDEEHTAQEKGDGGGRHTST